MTPYPQDRHLAAATLMLNRADEVAARDNHHGETTWRPIIEAVGQLVNKTLPGALH